MGATDLREGFDGLYGLARDCLGLDPLSGRLALFCNRQRKQTTFSIPMPTLGDPIPVASAVRSEGSPDSTHGSSGQPSGSWVLGSNGSEKSHKDECEKGFRYRPRNNRVACPMGLFTNGISTMSPTSWRRLRLVTPGVQKRR
ncbi:MAG: IS66 family insertion sequence element accessory protein TnpB [Verrucomicrobia bacterium]|nr:IS66 family insertion sequence element accessory protein TnpB [Verrucomicrobiota bacterium]